MLSDSTAKILDASVPILREHGLSISRAFYENMFEDHPELRNVFNSGNQANGSQQQSLASALFSYAAHHRNSVVLGPVLSHIVHKHAAMGVEPTHYVIVGHYLLAAMRQILGDALSPQIAAAWQEAYWDLATQLIATEARLYGARGGSPDHVLPLRVESIEEEAPGITSFGLGPLSGEKLPSFQPGQYISIQVDLHAGGRQRRQYSLSGGGSNHWRITVKKEAGGSKPDGLISHWLHDNLQKDQVVLATYPFGGHAFDAVSPENSVLLISAGIGITPMVSTLNAGRKSKQIRLLHASKDIEMVPHHKELLDIARADLGIELHFYITSDRFSSIPETLENVRYFEGHIAFDTALSGMELSSLKVFICGPRSFMSDAKNNLIRLGVAPENIHREVFGPDLFED